jgi:hypothetical protein
VVFSKQNDATRNSKKISEFLDIKNTFPINPIQMEREFVSRLGSVERRVVTDSVKGRRVSSKSTFKQ